MGKNLTLSIREIFKDLPETAFIPARRAIKRIIRGLGLNPDLREFVSALSYSKMLFRRLDFAIALLYLAKRYYTNWYLKHGLRRSKVFSNCEKLITRYKLFTWDYGDPPKAGP